MRVFEPERKDLQPLLDLLTDRMPDVEIVAYDGSRSGPDPAATRILIKTPKALARILRGPRGLGLARAWVAGEIEIEGDLAPVAAHETDLYDPRLVVRTLVTALRATVRLGIREFATAGATPIEYRAARPGRHSIGRDLAEAEFHYGLAGDFYAMLLGPSMTYSGAMFAKPADTLEDAQERKYDKICTKLELGKESTVLDIGCGWGKFLEHAVSRYGCRGIGFTASKEQHEFAVREQAATGQPVRLHHGDYRQLLPMAGVTAVASIGMYEHVGKSRSADFFTLVRHSLPTGARYLNQAITRREKGPHRLRANSFAQRYIFPNGQLLPLSWQLRDLDRAGFRVLSTESFGEGYALTVGKWLENLTANWDVCVAAVGVQRARAWRVYLAGSLRRFEDGTIDVTQVLAEVR